MSQKAWIAWQKIYFLSITTKLQCWEYQPTVYNILDSMSRIAPMYVVNGMWFPRKSEEEKNTILVSIV